MTTDAQVSRVFADTAASSVWYRALKERYPVIAAGDGSCLTDVHGNRYADAMSGAMVANLGHGDIPQITTPIYEQLKTLRYVYSANATSAVHEELARVLTGLAPPGFTRAQFATGGSEAIEAALTAARWALAGRGHPERHLVISAGQGYNGSTVMTRSLTARASLHAPHGPYIQPQAYFPPAAWRTDPTGMTALAEIRQVFARRGPEVAAIFLEPVTAMAYPAGGFPPEFWTGVGDLRDEHGVFLIFDEVVTGLGRTGKMFAADHLPVIPDIIVIGKGLGAGFLPVSAMLATEDVYQAAMAGAGGDFGNGHTWDGAPLAMRAGLEVVRYLQDHHLVRHVARQETYFRGLLTSALAGVDAVGDIRVRGLLAGVSYVNPRDPAQLPDRRLRFAALVDDLALDRGLIVRGNDPSGDGWGVGAQTTLAPPFTATGAELEQMTETFAAAVRDAAGRCGF